MITYSCQRFNKMKTKLQLQLHPNIGSEISSVLNNGYTTVARSRTLIWENGWTTWRWGWSWGKWGI